MRKLLPLLIVITCLGSTAIADGLSGSIGGGVGQFDGEISGKGGGAAPTNYYVSNSGLDTNNGLTPATPWQNIAKVNSSTFSGCSIINFNGGQTFTDTGLLVPSSGTPSCPLTFTSYGTGRATIAPTSATTNSFKVVDHDYITLNNINLVAGTASSFYLSSNTGLHSRITLNNFNATAGGGNYIGGDTGRAGWNNVLLENFLISGQTRDGLGVYGSGGAGVKVHTNITMKNGTISGNALSGVYFGNVNGGLIQNVIAHNNGAASTTGPVGIWTYESNAITIQFNESYNNTSANTIDGDGFDLDGGVTNSIVQYNYSHGNLGAGYLLYNYAGVTNNGNTIRYNISENDGSQPGGGYGGITIGNTTGATGTTSAAIYNNTIYNSQPSGFYAFVVQDSGAAATGNVANNIILNSSTGGLLFATGNPSTLLFTGNDYYATNAFSVNWNSVAYTSFASWQTATSQEKIGGTNVGQTSSPLLCNPGGGGTVGGYAPPQPTAYDLVTGSPMIGAGIDLNTQFSINHGTHDYYGNAIPEGSGTGYPVGAYAGAGVASDRATAPNRTLASPATDN